MVKRVLCFSSVRAMRRKDISRLLVNVVAIAIVLCGILAVPVPVRAQTPQPETREAIVLEIKEYAERHVENDTSMQGEFVVNIYRDNKVGLMPEEIGKIYDKEYYRLKKAKRSNIWEQLYPYGGWIAALIFVVTLVFQTVIREWTSSSIKKIWLSFYGWYVGTMLFNTLRLKQYRTNLKEQCRDFRVPFRRTNFNMKDDYVPLKVAETSDTNNTDAHEAVKKYRKLIVKGPPGSGKSILLKHLAFSYADGTLPLREQPIAILWELKELNYSQKSLEQHLVEDLEQKGFPNAERFVSQGLRRGRVMLLLDGLDEVNSEERPRVVREIWDLLKKLDSDRSRVIITCRTAIYKPEFDDRVDRTLKVVEFNQWEIRKFLRSWRDNMPEGKSVEQLMKKLQESDSQIMTLAGNPLMLAIIAYLYTTENSFELPRSRAQFYERATETLNQDNDYEAIDKRSVLQDLALYFQDNANSQEQDDRSVDRLQVFERVKKQLGALGLAPDKDVKKLLNEIMERSGLLLRIDGGDRYQFAHFTLQEFFAAAALSEEELLDRFEKEPDAWRETAKLWCALAEDSTTVIRSIYDEDQITAFECLADAKKVNQELAAEIIDAFKERLFNADPDDRIVKAFAAVAADNRPRGRAAFEFLEEKLVADKDRTHRSTAAKALSLTNSLKAAQVLAKHYQWRWNASEHLHLSTVAKGLPLTTWPDTDQVLANPRWVVSEHLVRMGDLAVSVLVALSAQGSGRAMDDLLAIGTPYAAEALVPFLWRDDKNLAAGAAWRLAGLLPQPNVKEALRDYPIREEHKKTDLLNWIGESFNEPADSALPVIAGRLAYLIANSPVTTAPISGLNEPVKLEERIVIPLCAIEIVGEIKLDDTNIKSIEQKLYRFAPVSKQTELVSETLNAIDASPLWRYLVNGLSLDLQIDLLHRLINSRLANRLPKPSDWIDLEKPTKYVPIKSFELWISLLLSIFVLTITYYEYTNNKNTENANDFFVQLANIDNYYHNIFGVTVCTIFLVTYYLLKKREKTLGAAQKQVSLSRALNPRLSKAATGKLLLDDFLFSKPIIFVSIIDYLTELICYSPLLALYEVYRIGKKEETAFSISLMRLFVSLIFFTSWVVYEVTLFVFGVWQWNYGLGMWLILVGVYTTLFIIVWLKARKAGNPLYGILNFPTKALWAKMLSSLFEEDERSL